MLSKVYYMRMDKISYITKYIALYTLSVYGKKYYNFYWLFKDYFIHLKRYKY
jgi:hypothetical protein